MPAHLPVWSPLSRLLAGAMLAAALIAPAKAAGPDLTHIAFSGGMVALDTATRSLIYGSVSGDVRSVLTSGDLVYWLNGDGIYRARPNLYGAELRYTAPLGIVPTDFAIAVPEPTSWLMALAGGLVLVAMRRRSS